MKFAFLATTVLLATALAGCTSPQGAGDRVVFEQAGSSTVLPVARAWAEVYRQKDPSVEIIVGGGGTGAGFKQFCRGELDISDASRPIKESERQECAAAGVTPFEIPVAIDGLAVVVSAQNTFVDYLSVEELNRIWTQDTSKQVNFWDEVRPGAGWPRQRIELYGPGTDSGTFDYFVEVIIHPYDGSQSRGRGDYTKSEDDHILVQGVQGRPSGLAYFGLAYVEDNQGRIRAVPIAPGNSTAAVAPTAENVLGDRYKPLARPIYMYTDGAPTGKLRDYFLFGLGAEGQALVDEAGYIPLPEALRASTVARIQGS